MNKYVCFCKCVCAFSCSHLPEGDSFPVKQPDWSSSRVKEQQLRLHFSCRRGKVCLIVEIGISWRTGRREERREGKRKGKKKTTKPLNGKVALLTCGQHVPCRLQEAAGAQVRGTGWAAAARSILAGWGSPAPQETGDVWRCTGQDREPAGALQQTQPGAQAGQMHGPCKVCYFFISLSFGLLHYKTEAGVY